MSFVTFPTIFDPDAKDIDADTVFIFNDRDGEAIYSGRTSIDEMVGLAIAVSVDHTGTIAPFRLEALMGLRDALRRCADMITTKIEERIAMTICQEYTGNECTSEMDAGGNVSRETAA